MKPLLFADLETTPYITRHCATVHGQGDEGSGHNEGLLHLLLSMCCSLLLLLD